VYIVVFYWRAKGRALHGYTYLVKPVRKRDRCALFSDAAICTLYYHCYKLWTM